MTKVSLIIPVYNEEIHLKQFLDLIDSVNLGITKELVLVDDCSKDKSSVIISEYKFKSDVKIIKHEQNQGKGAALRTGIAAASGSIIGIQDADFEYNPLDIPKLLSPLLENSADVVYGSRFRKNSTQVHRTYHYLINRFLTLLSNFTSGLYLSDMETCYKFFKSDVIKNIKLTSNRFGFEPEVTAKIARLKVRVSELPVSYFPRTYLAGKKITWKDGVAAIRHIFYFNFLEQKENFFYESLPEKYKPTEGMWL